MVVHLHGGRCLQALALRAAPSIKLMLGSGHSLEARRVRPLPQLQRLSLVSQWGSVAVEPALDLDVLPLLERLKLQSFSSVRLIASHPALHLTQPCLATGLGLISLGGEQRLWLL